MSWIWCLMKCQLNLFVLVFVTTWHIGVCYFRVKCHSCYNESDRVSLVIIRPTTNPTPIRHQSVSCATKHQTSCYLLFITKLNSIYIIQALDFLVGYSIKCNFVCVYYKLLAAFFKYCDKYILLVYENQLIK